VTSSVQCICRVRSLLACNRKSSAVIVANACGRQTASRYSPHLTYCFSSKYLRLEKAYWYWFKVNSGSGESGEGASNRTRRLD
jgi:hypothetical protein